MFPESPARRIPESLSLRVTPRGFLPADLVSAGPGIILREIRFVQLECISLAVFRYLPELIIAPWFGRALERERSASQNEG